MKNKLLFLLIACFLCSCQKYEDYIYDFDYSTVYFAYQRPVRTVFSDDLSIEIGVVLGGKRENKSDERVTFAVAPELLENPDYVGDNSFTLLPADYYTLSDRQTIVIPEGKFLGTVKLTLNADKFLSDPSALTRTYALPVRITGSTTDRILTADPENDVEGKDYTIIVIKYISQYQGVYYHRGERYAYDSSGRLLDVLKYVDEHEEDIYVKNLVWNLHTFDASSLLTDGVAEFLSDTKKYSMKIAVRNDGTVAVTDNPESGSSEITNIVDNGDSRYDRESRTFYLNYEYTDSSTGNRYVMKDILKYRNTEMSLELWEK